jgi:hypothetical protein
VLCSNSSGATGKHRFHGKARRNNPGARIPVTGHAVTTLEEGKAQR